MSQVLVVYDIVSDKARAKIANACMDYGLDRIQFSAFVGKLSRNKQEELMLRIKGILDDGEGRIALIPISENDWQHKLEISHEG